MKQNRKWRLASLIACIIFGSGCDSVSMKEVVVSAPQIVSFSPESGSIGSEIVVTGEYLDDVVSATIGGEKVAILQKVSNKRLSLKVTANAKSGKIELSNSVGAGVSENDYTLEYPAPAVSTTGMPAEVEMGNKLLISGSYMNVVSAVLFTAEGQSTGNEAEMISQDENEILVKIPYVESDRAVMTFKYFNGSAEVETPIESAPQMTVARYEPNVTTSSFEPVKVGDVVVLGGTYLNKVDKVLLGDIECNITVQNENELKFAVPSSDNYIDGDNTMELKISYFDGREVRTLTDAFVVKVPFVYFWENKTIYAQAREEGQFSSFFSPETGLVYANGDWREMVDPIAGPNTCSPANVPAVSESDYNSVIPYFFISGSSSKYTLALNSPANSNGQLKNFFISTDSKSSVTGGASWYGTPSFTFMYLDPVKYEVLVNEVKTGNIEKIDETTFPIEVETKKCRGITVSPSAAPTTDVWAKGIFEQGVEKVNVNIDAVLLVFYYDVNGYNPKDADRNGVANVKRIGILHVKKATFKMKEGTVKDPSASSITFDMYWQKHDYDYSKVQ